MFCCQLSCHCSPMGVFCCTDNAIKSQMQEPTKIDTCAPMTHIWIHFKKAFDFNQFLFSFFPFIHHDKYESCDENTIISKISVKFYGAKDITWASWCLKSLVIWYFVQWLVKASKKKISFVLPGFERGILHWPLDSPQKRLVMRTALSWHHYIHD